MLGDGIGEEGSGLSVGLVLLVVSQGVACECVSVYARP